ncbi:MAG: helix-turn-helix domain-containing protein, partial [Cyclobacteriaceae bacterium]|nr:helix-turn-helix domain-containing protein [Cyclobacteriaceae bacterium]
IAGLVGTATETVIRLLSEFKKDELIDFEGKKIIVLDKKGLARLSDFYG